ncbi:MAG: hypothetical protein QXQ82_00385 [Candidatus Pacearchaeota archaeon]
MASLMEKALLIAETLKVELRYDGAYYLKLDEAHFYPISKEDLEKIPLELLTKKIEEEIGRLKKYC